MFGLDSRTPSVLVRCPRCRLIADVVGYAPPLACFDCGTTLKLIGEEST